MYKPKNINSKVSTKRITTKYKYKTKIINQKVTNKKVSTKK